MDHVPSITRQVSYVTDCINGLMVMKAATSRKYRFFIIYPLSNFFSIVFHQLFKISNIYYALHAIHNNLKY